MPDASAFPGSLLAALAERLGARHVRTDPADLAPHLVESRGLYRGHALAVVTPGTTEEVAFAVQACAAARVPVVAQGGNTGLVGGGVPFGGTENTVGSGGDPLQRENPQAPGVCHFPGYPFRHPRPSVQMPFPRPI